MNIERMRRANERTQESVQRDEHRRWLASMTPAHRRVHERGLPCSECLRRSLERMQKALRR